MKIGIIAHDAHPISQPFQGGLEMITALIVNELHMRGHEVTTLCVRGSNLPGSLVYYTKAFTIDDRVPELISIGNFSYSLNEFLKRDYDIIHNHSLHHQAIIMGNVLPIPFITSFHTPIFENINVGLRCIEVNINQFFTGVSESLCGLYRHLVPSISTVYNGIDVYKWDYIHEPEDYYSWSGRICKEKGLKEIIDLCDNFRLQLRIAGPISNKEYYRQEIVPRLKKSPYCSYAGHFDHSQLNHFIGKSKGFLFSSVWEEPYGLVIAEALACGVPVIANNVGAAKEIVTDECGTLFNLDNYQSFHDAIINANGLRRENCRERAIEFCSHYRMVDAYEELYFKVTRRKLAV